MRVLNSILMCGLIASITIKPLEASDNTSKTLGKYGLVDYFDQGIEIIEKEFSKNTKILVNKLLNDGELQQAKTSPLKEFRNNLTDYLYNYDSYIRYRLSNVLILQWDNIIRKFQDNRIIQLLNKYGYNQMRKDYEKQYDKFIKQKFLPQFEEHKIALINWGNNLKSCSDYKCQSKYIDMLVFENITPRSDLLLYYRDYLNNIFMFIGKSENNIAHRLLKSSNLTLLGPGVQKNLTTNLLNFIKYYEQHASLSELLDLIEYFGENILEKYYYNSTLPLNVRKVIKKIFDEEGGYAKFHAKYAAKLKEFIHVGLFQKFQQFKATLKQKELAKEQDLLEWYDHLKDLTNVEDIIEELNEYYYDD